ncbi:MAG: SLC13 family permease [Desulfobulbaceae bacterium]|nr:SLC13 family permease [Desulfobulbaceae bacterium]
MLEKQKANPKDPFDMNNYRMEKLPIRIKSPFEQWLERLGLPIALFAFILLIGFIDIPFLQEIDPATLTAKAKDNYNTIGAENFSKSNMAMLAIFVASLILWITEAIPNYLTSLILIVTIVLTGVLPEKVAYAQLGHPVMWLNILSFILASMLVKTGAAKRFALWFILRFGKNAPSIFLSFIIINVVLSAFISATTAKAAILLPIFMVIAAVYGARGGENRNNFGRNIVLQNLLCINISAGCYVTGSGANLLAAAMIGGAIGGNIFFQDWLIIAFPVSFSMLFVGWLIGTRIFFPLTEEESHPQVEGGMDTLKKELAKMGKISFMEVKSVIIFITILAMWATDKYHGISPTAVAFVGACVALFPRVGVVRWNDVDIPWHLLMFSAGAYTLGAGLQLTDLPSLMVNSIVEALGLSNGTPFWVFYVTLTGTMLFSALIFQSKTMRTLLFIPIAIGIANRFGYPIISLAIPVAMLIEHVYVLPFNSKPALLLYATDQYSLTDTFKFGFTMLVIAWFVVILMGETYYRFLGYTPNGVFGFF